MVLPLAGYLKPGAVERCEEAAVVGNDGLDGCVEAMADRILC